MQSTGMASPFNYPALPFGGVRLLILVLVCFGQVGISFVELTDITAACGLKGREILAVYDHCLPQVSPVLQINLGCVKSSLSKSKYFCSE